MKNTSRVTITEVDKSEIVPSFPGICKISTPNTGPLNKFMFLGTKIPEIKWYQFWRYHLIKKRHQEEKEAIEKFHKIFGQPKN